MKKMKRIFSIEIAIEYKTCLYAFCVLFFYCVYLLCVGTFSANILYLFEIFCVAYVIGYLQYYLLDNFDEAERLSGRNWAGLLICTTLYTAVSYLLNWLDRNLIATMIFFVFMFAMYYFIYLINKVKRFIDTENLNEMLLEFKKGEKHD